MCDFAALFAGWNWGDLWVDGNYSGTVPNKGLSLENYTYLIDLLKAQNVCEIFSVLIHVKNVCNSFPKGFWYIWFWTPCSSQRGNYRIFMSFRFYVKSKLTNPEHQKLLFYAILGSLNSVWANFTYNRLLLHFRNTFFQPQLNFDTS